jgi:hypothetical protein
MAFMKRIAGATALGVAMLTGYGLWDTPAQAGYVVDLTQQGANVVATGSGAIALTGLSFVYQTGDAGFIAPAYATIITGPANFTQDNYYTGYTGPTSFGSGANGIAATTGSGDLIGVGQIFTGNPSLLSILVVPLNYVSGDPLSDTSTFTGQTFSTLGVTPGTYEWTWGTGTNQNFTLEIGSAVPESSTWAMMLLGFFGLGFMAYRRKQNGSAVSVA